MNHVCAPEFDFKKDRAQCTEKIAVDFAAYSQ